MIVIWYTFNLNKLFLVPWIFKYIHINKYRLLYITVVFYSVSFFILSFSNLFCNFSFLHRCKSRTEETPAWHSSDLIKWFFFYKLKFKLSTYGTYDFKPMPLGMKNKHLVSLQLYILYLVIFIKSFCFCLRFLFKWNALRGGVKRRQGSISSGDYIIIWLSMC